MILIAIMATIGMGGGFAGLIWGWRDAERAMNRERARCRFGWCAFRSAGRLFQRCPCVTCESKRLRAEVRRFNASLARMRTAMLALREETRRMIAQLRGSGDVITAATKENQR